MKIIAPTAGSVTRKKTVGYVINIAKRLSAQLVVLRVLNDNETEAAGEKSFNLFIETGKKQKSGKWYCKARGYCHRRYRGCRRKICGPHYFGPQPWRDHS